MILLQKLCQVVLPVVKVWVLVLFDFTEWLVIIAGYSAFAIIATPERLARMPVLQAKSRRSTIRGTH